MSESPHVLVATLGGQPQVVTFTLDLLLQKGYPIHEVIVIHPKATSQSRLQRALQRLHAEFTGKTYPGTHQVIHFHSHALKHQGKAIDDITNDDQADGTLETIHQLIGDLKRQGYHIHMSVSGGRRLIALLAISVATLSFDRHDKIWHIHTPEHIQEQAHDGAVMHVPADAGVKLIQGPFIALGTHIIPGQSFRSVHEEQRSQRDKQERARCAKVEERATPAQRKVLRAFAKGLMPQQVADELSITLATVNSHKTALLGYCYNAWNMPDDEKLKYQFLHTKFRDYFQSDA